MSLRRAIEILIFWVCAVIVVGSVCLLGSLLVLTEVLCPQFCEVASKKECLHKCGSVPEY
jgi:hypothetical protein